MMKFCLVALVAVWLVLAIEAKPKEGGAYDKAFVNFDPDAIVADPEKMKVFLKCFQGTGPCKDGSEKFTEIFPDAVKTACAKCSTSQKRDMRKFMLAATTSHPLELAGLVAKLDPETKYIPALLTAVLFA